MTKHIGEESRESLADLIEALRRDRQRLQVQMNLGRMELRDDWARVEEKWTEVEHHLADLSEESAKRVEHLGHEVAEAYRALKTRLGISD